MAARVTRGRNIRIASRDDILQEIDEARLRGVRFTTAGDPDYPPMLAEIADAPPMIALRGDSSVCARDAIGIVGSRNASADGLAFAERTDLFDRPEPEEALDPLFDELDFFAAPPSPRFEFENQSGVPSDRPSPRPCRSRRLIRAG